jgi:hydroxymethylglutaryl-CoA lyase
METLKKDDQQQLISLIECPRDAMQGWKTFIPTEKKAEYLNSLLQVGFDTLDFGSFVSAKAIPQMADTHAVLKNLDLRDTKTKLLAIVANTRGAEEAAAYGALACLGFPFSVSETFQQRNTHSSMTDSLVTVERIQDICLKYGKTLVVYISMGFGNPYGDPWSAEIVFDWVYQISQLGVRFISLADTVGLSTPAQVSFVTGFLVQQLPDHVIGVHLHSRPETWKPKIEAALKSGCLRFDGALKGIGGCPMANDVLVGNMNTEWMMDYFKPLGLLPRMDQEALIKSIRLAEEIFI